MLEFKLALRFALKHKYWLYRVVANKKQENPTQTLRCVSNGLLVSTIAGVVDDNTKNPDISPYENLFHT